MRLIDADVLLKTIEESTPLNWTDSAEEIQACNDYSLFIEEIKSAPTIDPVKHGHWKEEEAWDFSTYYRCSCCGEDFCTIDGTEPKENLFNYCPNCGAKMDEVNE